MLLQQTIRAAAATVLWFLSDGGSVLASAVNWRHVSLIRVQVRCECAAVPIAIAAFGPLGRLGMMGAGGSCNAQRLRAQSLGPDCVAVASDGDRPTSHAGGAPGGARHRLKMASKQRMQHTGRTGDRSAHTALHANPRQHLHSPEATALYRFDYGLPHDPCRAWHATKEVRR